MMEQPQMGERNSHVVFIRRFNHMVVADGAAGFRHVLYAAAVSPFNVVAEGEEGIAS